MSLKKKIWHFFLDGIAPLPTPPLEGDLIARHIGINGTVFTETINGEDATLSADKIDFRPPGFTSYETVVETLSVWDDVDANTGLAYDPVNDYFIIGKYNETTSSKIVIKNRANVLINTIDVTAVIDFIQGVAYDPVNEIYYFWGQNKGTSTWVIKGVNSSGTVVFGPQATTPTGVGYSSIAYDDGHLWFYYTLTGDVYKIRISDWVTVYTHTHTVGGEGIAVDSDGNYWIGMQPVEGKTLQKFSSTGTLLKSIPAYGQNELEGICLTTDGYICVNSDELYHSTGALNAIWVYDIRPLTTLYLLDKSDSTIHISTALMDYYNAANPWEWTKAELLDFAKYNTYFKPAYINRLFTRVDTGVIVEVLSYATKKETGTTDFNDVIAYCEIDLIVPELYDGNTVGWYKKSATATIIKDGSDLVGQWTDAMGTGHDLIQITSGFKPLDSAAGILFDGIDNYLRTATFTFNQPQEVYIVLKQITFTSADRIFSGFTADTMMLDQRNASPNIRIYAGGSVIESTELALNTLGIIRALFSGAASTLQVNENPVKTGSIGTAAAAGFSLGCNGNGTNPSNIEVVEIILRNVADVPATKTAIYNYLEAEHG